MTTIKIKIEQEQKEAFQEVEIQFPIYVLYGYSGRKEEERRGVKTTTSNTHLIKIVSPTQYFELEKTYEVKSDGRSDVRLEMRHCIKIEPNTSAGWYLIGENSYSTASTESDWQKLVREHQNYLKKLK